MKYVPLAIARCGDCGCRLVISYWKWQKAWTLHLECEVFDEEDHWKVASPIYEKVQDYLELMEEPPGDRAWHAVPDLELGEMILSGVRPAEAERMRRCEMIPQGGSMLL